MKSLITLAALLPLISAVPTTVRRRALHQRDYPISNATSCPRLLPAGNYESPSMIVPISQDNPDKQFSTSPVAVFTANDMSTIFNFEIPPERAGQNCTLEFLFPLPSQLAPGASYLYSGAGTFFFTGYEAGSGPNQNTTFATQPPLGPYPPFPPVHMSPGNAYTIDVGPCVAGTVVAGLTGTNDTTFVFQPDDGSTDGSCPIGVFVAYTPL